MARNITITEDDFNDIMKYFAFPVIDFSVFPYSQEQVENLFIWPALREYYKWFPIKNIVEYPISRDINIDFPTDDTYTILSSILNTNIPSSGTGVTGDPIIDSANLLSSNSRFGRRYGTPYNYGQNVVYHYTRAENKALVNSQNAYRLVVDRTNRKAVGYSNVAGRVTITWGEYSTDFSRIEFTKIEDVVKLAASYIYDGWGSMLSMQSTALTNELNGDWMLDKAETLKEEVITKWEEYSKVVVMKNA